jgi:hypothetical protein
MERIFNCDIGIIFDACKQAIGKLGMKIEYINKGKGIISASTKTSVFSWGETIDITLKEKYSGKTNVVIESNSKAQLFSWGKNEKNEEDILETINQIVKK